MGLYGAARRKKKGAEEMFNKMKLFNLKL